MLTKEERIKRLEKQIEFIQNEPVDVFPARLKETIKKRRISESRVACLAGCTQQSMNYYTTGKRQPSLQTAVKIAKILNVDLNYLVGLKDTE